MIQFLLYRIELIWKLYRGMRRHAQGALLHELHQQRLRKSHDAAANSNGLLLFHGRWMGQELRRVS
jgi:hypothetical protein